MDLFFKRSTIHIDCFTSYEVVYNNFRIDTASKFFPDSIKQLPNTVSLKANANALSKLRKNISTIRLCQGLKDLFTSGFILPAWSDIDMECTADGNVIISSTITDIVGGSICQQHERFQYGNKFYPEMVHFKLLVPWYLKEKTGVKFTWNSCDWHRTDRQLDFKLLSGVIDFKYQHQVNINGFMYPETISNIFAGEPLIHMIPISDKSVKLHHHLISHDEMMLLDTNTIIETSYRNYRKLKTEESKCPFGFGKK